MAYIGPIEYMKAKPLSYDWEEIESPWSRGGSGLGVMLTGGSGTSFSLTAKLYDVRPVVESKVFYDQPGGSEKAALQCIVLAVRKAQAREPQDGRLNYVMFVKQRPGRSDREGARIYERVGVGEVLGKALVPKGFTVRIY
jgi:hypothetical protein